MVTNPDAIPLIPEADRVTADPSSLTNAIPETYPPLYDDWVRTFEAFRPVLLSAWLVSVTGPVQNENGVIHIVCEKIEDLTPLLRRLSDAGDKIETLHPPDHVKRPINSRRHPRAGDTLVTLFRDDPALAGELALDVQTSDMQASDVQAVMPKGRNFH